MSLRITSYKTSADTVVYDVFRNKKHVRVIAKKVGTTKTMTIYLLTTASYINGRKYKKHVYVKKGSRRNTELELAVVYFLKDKKII